MVYKLSGVILFYLLFKFKKIRKTIKFMVLEQNQYSVLNISIQLLEYIQHNLVLTFYMCCIHILSYVVDINMLQQKYENLIIFFQILTSEHMQVRSR